MLKRLSTLAAALLISTALHAEPVSGGRANVVIQPEPPSLMVGLIQNGPTQMVAGNIYEGLLRYDKDLEPEPQLAKSWEISEDGLTYTFHLHENVKWHDGEPFTSADVVFSADEFLRETHPRLRTSLEHVESITAPDDHTVVFKLKQPFGPFIGIFEVGTMPMIPKHIYEGTEYENNPANNTPIGTGPFKFEEWERGSHILLTKNEEYYEEGLPYLDEIYWHVIPDAASRAVAYEAGVVDILPGGSVENFDVQRIADMENTCITDEGWEYFGPHSWMWLNNREGPTADKRFRQAVMYAMDRNFAKDALWNGLGKVATGPVSSSTRFYSDDVKQYEYDPEQAKALLEEMGYDGETVRLLPLPYGETWQRWAEAVKQNLEEVGINAEIVATDVAGWNQKLAEWDYDMAFTYLYQYGDPALGVARNYISTNIAKGSQWNNVEGYENPKVDELFEKAAVAVTQEERQELYNEIQQILVEDVPVAWLLELGFPTIYRCNVKDLVTTAIGVNDGFKNAYVEE
ncbi:ABC transporter substrate-binding protein [Chelativorans sp. YIM 93263]|uniref:ABC transporter substrate-binding protein n=1 Tax=Chelativorans sp. YIM 93263 TaxID=2906648 RepID=UPI002378474E|nr:ABC transporter substrate-binding protein [Chelativorans sp. YIM 93263]